MSLTMDLDIDQQAHEAQREYLDFLDDEDSDKYYSVVVSDAINKQQKRIIVNINDLRQKNPKRAAALLNDAFHEMVAFHKALKEYVGSIDAAYIKEKGDMHIGLEGSFGAKHVTPRTLTARCLGNIVCVEGIVTKCSLVRPKVGKSVHYCPATKKSMERTYTDMTSMDPFPSSAAYPTKDEDGNSLETEYGLSVYKDHQTLSIQEMPEKAPAGQLPRSVDIVCDNDLVDTCKPGDRVQVIGIYRCLPGKQGAYTSGAFRTLMIANNIIQMSKEATPKVTKDDLILCKRFSRQRSDPFELLAKSLAPSIHGHEYIKKALLCMLLGGVEKVLQNGTRLRGDVNVLLIGDPSVAKSQLLRYVMQTAPRAIQTTGRGSSGVGLTAAVTTDQETGERRLEAGAMVLADRGVVCIDEFDKMTDMDRTAIHEVMEQGRVTVAKAGIHAQLNARCSVLAAANPVYGRYDQYRTPMENIGLQDSLLSRFDLLFIMLDTIDKEQDRVVADHVMRIHRYRAPGEQEGEVLPMGSACDILSTKDPNKEDEDDDQPEEIYEKYDPLLHGTTRKKTDKIFSIGFMKKYIHVAKCIKPKLTQEASDQIANEYIALRSLDTENTDVARTQPVTPRSLETLIRLSTAHAKARLSKTVDAQDAASAIELIQYACFKKVLEKPHRHRRNSGSGEDSQGDEEMDTGNVTGSQDGPRTPRSSAKKRKRAPRAKEGEEGYDPYDWETDGDETPRKLRPSASARAIQKATQRTGAATDDGGSAPSTVMVEEVTLTAERLASFRASVNRIFQSRHTQSLPVASIEDQFTLDNPNDPFSTAEFAAAFHNMSEDNQIMVTDDFVFLI